MFPIYDVSTWLEDRPEALGSKAKTWLIPDRQLGLPAERYLFKVGRPNTGENWAEKVCCEILKLLGIPCAAYDLAVRDGTQGVISASFVPDGASFIPANTILSKFDPAYDGSLKFRQPRYTMSAALELLAIFGWELPLGSSQVYRDMPATEMFIGYLLFDALIGNTDRHHENWGLVYIPDSDRTKTIAGGATVRFLLAPSFDHASVSAAT